MKTETKILKRLGNIPLWKGRVNALQELDRMYSKAATIRPGHLTIERKFAIMSIQQPKLGV